MAESLPDIGILHDQLDAAERDACLLVEDLDEERGCWRAEATEWSVAQCLDHLATSNRVYLDAMEAPTIRARAAGRFRQRPALPGFLGRWFAGKMDPPASPSSRMYKQKAPRKIKPDASSTLHDAFARFLKSQDEIRDYIRTNADLDLAGIRFPNPFVPVVRFSLATGLHVLIAHERRHLWQAWRARRAAKVTADQAFG